jgi:hypothetical protein
MSSFTDKIRNIFLEQDTVTVFSLYEQFTDSGELKDVIDYQKHQIRSIVNNLRKKEEIVRIDQGTYKKTDKLGTRGRTVKKIPKEKKVRKVKKKEETIETFEENIEYEENTQEDDSINSEYYED